VGDCSLIADAFGLLSPPEGVLELPVGATLAAEDEPTRVLADLGQDHTDKRGFGTFEPELKLDVESGRAPLDLGPGLYVLRVTAVWPETALDYYFGVKLVGNRGSPPDVADGACFETTPSTGSATCSRAQ
jgi:hypothetical protein